METSTVSKEKSSKKKKSKPRKDVANGATRRKTKTNKTDSSEDSNDSGKETIMHEKRKEGLDIKKEKEKGKEKKINNHGKKHHHHHHKPQQAKLSSTLEASDNSDDDVPNHKGLSPYEPAESLSIEEIGDRITEYWRDPFPDDIRYSPPYQFEPRLGNPYEWAFCRCQIFAGGDRIKLRIFNQKLRLDLFNSSTGETRWFFTMTQRVAKKYLPPFLTSIHFDVGKRSSISLYERSLATINVGSVTNPRSLSRGTDKYPIERNRGTSLQRVGIGYVHHNDLTAPPYIATRLHAIAMSNEVLPHGKMTGQTILRLLACWTSSGPGATILYPWNKSGAGTPVVEILRNVYLSYGTTEHIEKWVKVLESHRESKNGRKWEFVLATELALIHSRQLCLPSDEGDSFTIVSQYMQPIWNHKTISDYKDTFMGQCRKMIPHLQRVFADTIHYSVQETVIAPLSHVLRTWHKQCTSQDNGQLTRQQLLSLSVWVTQILLGIDTLSYSNIIHGNLTLDNVYLVEDNIADTSHVQYTVRSSMDPHKTFGIYLPQAFYQGVACHATISNFDRACSSIHTGLAMYSDNLLLSSYDLLTFQKDWRDFEKNPLLALIDKYFGAVTSSLYDKTEDNDGGKPSGSSGILGWFSGPKKKTTSDEKEEEEVNDVNEAGDQPKNTESDDGDNDDDGEHNEKKKIKTRSEKRTNTPSANVIVSHFGLGCWRMNDGDSTEISPLFKTEGDEEEEEPTLGNSETTEHSKKSDADGSKKEENSPSSDDDENENLAATSPLSKRIRPIDLYSLTASLVLERSIVIRKHFHDKPQASHRIHQFEHRKIGVGDPSQPISLGTLVSIPSLSPSDSSEDSEKQRHRHDMSLGNLSLPQIWKRHFETPLSSSAKTAI